MASKILLVEDDRALREALADTLALGGHDYRAVDCAESALLAIAEEPFGLVVSDVNMPGMDGHQLLAQIRQSQPQLPVLLMTAFGAVERAVDAMRQGAADYLVKPFEPKALLTLVDRHALGRVSVSEQDGPVAEEPASVQLLALATRVAQSDSTVLITGESGTGKEVLARFIHQQSPRGSKPFIAINCAAIPDNMLEATLFGHEKGAFTGAIASAPASSNWPKVAPFCSTKFLKCHWACRPSCCACCRSVRWSGWARASQLPWISVCWPPVTAIWPLKWRRGVSGRTSTIACRFFRWLGGHCVSVRRTSCRWPSAYWLST